MDQCTVLDVGCGGGSTFRLLVDSDAAVQEVNKSVPCYITIALKTSEMDCPKRCMFEVRNPFGGAEHLETCLIRAVRTAHPLEQTRHRVSRLGKPL